MTLIDTTSQRFASATQPEPDVCVIHTTEGTSWPGYSGGGEAPHATIMATPGKGILVREHINTGDYAKALMNLPGGVETNRRGVLQYELVGTCDPKRKGQPGWYYWPDADDVVLAALADYLRPILAKYLIPHTAPAFQAYNASYGPRGATNKVRMTGAQWVTFNGICGHEHVPENIHGDPGAFPIGMLIGYLSRTHPSTTAKDTTMATVTELEAALRKVLAEPAVLKGIARFVAEGYPTGNPSLVLGGHLTVIEDALARIENPPIKGA